MNWFPWKKKKEAAAIIAEDLARVENRLNWTSARISEVDRGLRNLYDQLTVLSGKLTSAESPGADKVEALMARLNNLDATFIRVNQRVMKFEERLTKFENVKKKGNR